MRIAIAFVLVCAATVALPCAADPAAGAASAGTRAARDLVHTWLIAQNSGQLDVYRRLYAPSFSGIRRSGARVVKLDRAGWLRDRARMFQKPMRVSVAGLDVAATAKGFEVGFVQWFRSGSYEDEGEKRMVLAPVDGELRIVFEEMLASRTHGGFGAFRPVVQTARGAAVVLQVSPPRSLGAGAIEMTSSTEGSQPVPTPPGDVARSYTLFGDGKSCGVARVTGYRILYRGSSTCDAPRGPEPTLERDGQRLWIADVETSCLVATLALPSSLPPPEIYPLKEWSDAHAETVAGLLRAEKAGQLPASFPARLLSIAPRYCTESGPEPVIAVGKENGQPVELLFDSLLCRKPDGGFLSAWGYIWSLWMRGPTGLELRDAGFLQSELEWRALHFGDRWTWAVDLNGDGRLDLLGPADVALLSSPAGYTASALLAEPPITSYGSYDDCDDGSE